MKSVYGSERKGAGGRHHKLKFKLLSLTIIAFTSCVLQLTLFYVNINALLIYFSFISILLLRVTAILYHMSCPGNQSNDFIKEKEG